MTTMNKYFDPTYANNWLNSFSIGLLSIYIDDYSTPIFQYYF